MFYVSDVVLISLLQAVAHLLDVRHMACITCKFNDSALVLLLYIAVYFWLCEVLWIVDVLKGYSQICVFE